MVSRGSSAFAAAVTPAAAAFTAVENQRLVNAMFVALLLLMLGIGGAISLYVIWRSKG